MVHAEITVAAVVERDGRFLVVEEQVAGARVINQPAGHLEPGETLVDAVIRETREESAWRLEPVGLVGVYHWVHDDGRTTIRFAFCGNVGSHAGEQSLDDGIVAAHWYTPDELATCANLRSPLVLRAVEDYGARPPMALHHLCHLEG